jgi:hypothetical protein
MLKLEADWRALQSSSRGRPPRPSGGWSEIASTANARLHIIAGTKQWTKLSVN